MYKLWLEAEKIAAQDLLRRTAIVARTGKPLIFKSHIGIWCVMRTRPRSNINDDLAELSTHRLHRYGRP